MTLNQSALLELTEVLRSADGGDLMRLMLATMLQALVDAEAAAHIGAAPARTNRHAHDPAQRRPRQGRAHCGRGPEGEDPQDPESAPLGTSQSASWPGGRLPDAPWPGRDAGADDLRHDQGAKDVPRIIYTLSQKQTGSRQRREKFRPLATTSGPSPEATG